MLSSSTIAGLRRTHRIPSQEVLRGGWPGFSALSIPWKGGPWGGFRCAASLRVHLAAAVPFLAACLRISPVFAARRCGKRRQLRFLSAARCA